MSKPDGPSDETKTLRYARAALWIAAASMLASAVTATFDVWKYRKSGEVNLSMSCSMRRAAPIDLVPSALVRARRDQTGFRLRGNAGSATIAVVEPPGNFIVTTEARDVLFDSRDYSTSIALTMECRVFNSGQTKASVSDLYASLYVYDRLGRFVELLNVVPVLGVLDTKLEPRPLPFTIEPGGIEGLVVGVAWPIRDKSIQQFKTLCGERWASGQPLSTVLSCIYPRSLTESFGTWPSTRLQFRASTPDHHGAATDLIDLGAEGFH